MPSIFPSTSAQACVATMYIVVIATLAHCISRKVAAEDFSSWESIRQITWPRLCVLLVFVDSLLFIALSNIVVYGIGLETSASICSGAIYLCIFCYASSKVLTYCFLIEKVHIVLSPASGLKRLRSKVWICSAVVVSLYCVVIAVMFFGRIHFFRPDDTACMIGLQPYSAIPLLSYDVFVNVFFTTLFLWPLLRSRLGNPKIRAVAARTLVAAGVSLTTSTVNISMLAVFGGHELGWVCLGLCGCDIMVNALALFWVTSGAGSHVSQPGRDRSADGSRHYPRMPSAPLTPRKSTFLEETPTNPFPSSKPDHVLASDYDYLTNSETRVNFSEAPLKVQHCKTPSVVKSVTKLIRGSPDRMLEERNLQVTITQETNVEHSLEDMDGRKGDENV